MYTFVKESQGGSCFASSTGNIRTRAYDTSTHGKSLLRTNPSYTPLFFFVQTRALVGSHVLFRDSRHSTIAMKHLHRRSTCVSAVIQTNSDR